MGLGATVWTLLLGMVVSNGVARVASIEFLQPAAKLAEFYIKVGLVLLAVELSSLAQVDAAHDCCMCVCVCVCARACVCLSVSLSVYSSSMAMLLMTAACFAERSARGRRKEKNAGYRVMVVSLRSSAA